MRIRVTPKDRFGVEERIHFHHMKTKRSVTLSVAWRSGSVWMSEAPDLSAYLPERGMLMENYDDEDLSDGDDARVIGASSEAEAETLAEAWMEDLEDGMASHGWQLSDRELWFFGKLDVRAEAA